MDTDATTRIVVIGSGIAGILTGIELRSRGLTDFTILEKAETFGGTWRDNVYPGVACDVPAHLYSFSFAPNVAPTRRFASGPELWDYFRHIADSYGITELRAKLTPDYEVGCKRLVISGEFFRRPRGRHGPPDFADFHALAR